MQHGCAHMWNDLPRLCIHLAASLLYQGERRHRHHTLVVVFGGCMLVGHKHIHAESLVCVHPRDGLS